MDPSAEDAGGSSHNTAVVAVTVTAGLLTALYLLYQRFLASSRPKKVLPLQDFIAVPLVKKEILSHDVRRFTFALPCGDSVLGLPIGQHLSLKFIDPTTDKPVQRSYTPVTDDACIGYFSLVLKVYSPLPPKFPKGGAMSQHLDGLQIGETILMHGPKGHLHYQGNDGGKFHVKPLGKPAEDRSCDNIAMIAGGTGITPMLQILHAIFRSTMPDAKVNVKLLFANQSPHDVLVRDELEQLALDFPQRFSVWYTVDRVDPAVHGEWKYDTGFISKAMVQEHLSFPTGKTQVFMCGPPPMIKFACLPALTDLGYSEKEWVVF